MKPITAAGAVNIARTTRGKIFSIRFEKADGSLRLAVCRTGVKRGVKGVMNPKARQERAEKFLTVYDLKKPGFILVNIEKIRFIKVRGIEYVVI